MDFSVRSVPTRPAVELRSVRRSLNTPVLAIAELPVGPGSAAIAVHVDPCGDLPRYTLAVRCERSREVVFFSARAEGLGLSDSSLAGEGALSLAEGMGFLFEEDLLQISGEAAASIWGEFVDSANPIVDAVAVPATPLLTKFRRPASWSSAGPAEGSAAEAESHRAARGANTGFDRFDSQIARQGDR
jgi:hypothetical protein